MLAGVGCKDYDDDINKINDRIDELTTGKIADIESQLRLDANDRREPQSSRNAY